MDCKKYDWLSIQMPEGLRFAARDSVQGFRIALSMIRFGVWSLRMLFLFGKMV